MLSFQRLLDEATRGRDRHIVTTMSPLLLQMARTARYVHAVSDNENGLKFTFYLRELGVKFHVQNLESHEHFLS